MAGGTSSDDISAAACRTIAFCQRQPERREAAAALQRALSATSIRSEADVIVALGGDGLMLQTLHRFMNDRKPIYGMNRGSVGFLMNEYREDGLLRAARGARSATSSIRC